MKQFLLLSLLLILSSSCNFPEHYFTEAPICKAAENTSNLPLSEASQQRIKAQLKTKAPTDFRYFFKTFLEEADKSYMITNFRNKESCFDVKVLIEEWYPGHLLAGMHRTNGVAYPKELYDLKWDLKIINQEEEIVYLTMHRIID